MLPFPRLSQYNNVVDHKILLDIDFSRQNIGDSNVYDFSQNSVFSLISGTAGTVQYDSTIGSNVMSLSGTGRYISPINKATDLTNRSFIIESTFKCNTTSPMVLWETGDWNGSRIPGMLHSMNSFPSTYNQYFMDDGSQYNRVLLNGTNTLEWETITFIYNKGVGISTYRKLTDTTQTFPAYPYAKGINLSIFGSYTGGNEYFFNGLVKSIKITEL